MKLPPVVEACLFLADQGFNYPEDYRLGDAIEMAGDVILELEAGDPRRVEVAQPQAKKRKR